jgi:uridine kinase
MAFDHELACCFPSLPEASRGRLGRYLEALEVAAGQAVVREGANDGDAYLVVEGQARVSRAGLEVSVLEAGDHFGELALLAGRPRSATVVATTAMRLLRLSGARYGDLVREAPDLAISLVHALVDGLGESLSEMTERVNVLLRERSLPRRSSVEITIDGARRRVPTGTLVGELLPREVDGAQVVAALLDRRIVGLDTPLASDATLMPLDTRRLEGDRIRRATLGLLLLAAAREVAPRVVVRLGSSLGAAQVVELAPGVHDTASIAAALDTEMRRLVAADANVVREWWTVEEARTHFVDLGDHAAADLLSVYREPMVPLVSIDGVYAIGFGPLLPSAGRVGEFRVQADGERLFLVTGDERGDAPRSARPAAEAMTSEHALWLRSLGITSVGAFDAKCIAGDVPQIVRISEGFHEKRLSRIADEIVSRRDRVRVICVAGPSSSGKTTFIKRLTVQLEVVGLRPIGISLDDYYVDRDKTPLDEKGEYDFEAFEALDAAMLQDELTRVLRGEPVRLARFDFVHGKSLPGGGAEVALGERDVLVVEGIHGLHPKLFAGHVPTSATYNIFVCPLTGLPMDALTRVPVSDIRLLRRIVRDRHGRSQTAEGTIRRWASVRAGERKHIFPHFDRADAVFDSSLVYEPSVLKVYAERYLLEVPPRSESFPTAFRLLELLERFVSIYPEHVPATSILREFIGGSSFSG